MEQRVAAPQPLQGHRCMLALVVAVVAEHRCERHVVGGLHPLVVPVDRLQLLGQRDDGPMTIDGLVVEELAQLVGSPTLATARILSVGDRSSVPHRASRSNGHDIFRQRCDQEQVVSRGPFPDRPRSTPQRSAVRAPGASTSRRGRAHRWWAAAARRSPTRHESRINGLRRRPACMPSTQYTDAARIEDDTRERSTVMSPSIPTMAVRSCGAVARSISPDTSTSVEESSASVVVTSNTVGTGPSPRERRRR